MTALLGAALVKAQQDMPAVEKTGRSNFGAHVTLDHLIAKTRPHLAKHGLAITQFIEHTDTGQPALRTILMHESGEQVAATMPLLLTKLDMQQLGAATTYARRYAWAAALGISSETDDDADSISLPAQAASTGSGGRAQGGGGAAAAAPPPPANGGGAFTFPSGKHQGKTLGEVDVSYLDWYEASGPRDDVKAAIAEYRGGPPAPVADDDIPF